MWTHLIKIYWRTLVDLLPMINPLTTGLFFLNFVEGKEPAHVKRAAFKIGIYMVISLVIILLIGESVLHFFGITMPYIRVAGGILIFASGWKILNANKPKTTQRIEKLNEILFYPMTIPFTVGGGTIATVLALDTYVDQNRLSLIYAEEGAVIVGILTIAIVVIMCCFWAPRIKRFLGEGGITVVLFTFALILLPLGLTVIWGGLSTLIHQLVL